MDGVLSQEEINALLNNPGASSDTAEGQLSDSEKDTIGEIANISMGTAATTLFSLVNRKVEISTPVVTMANCDDVVKAYERPCVFIRIGFTVGLDGSNILILKEHDVKVITDLMMGGPGNVDPDEPLTELHLSAIGEAMNQMMGSAATSLSSMFNRKIDISPPIANLVETYNELDDNLPGFLKNHFVMVAFKMQIGELIDSEIMQLYPKEFAQELLNMFMPSAEPEQPQVSQEDTANHQEEQVQQAPAQNMTQTMPQQDVPVQNTTAQTAPQQGMPMQNMGMPYGYGMPMQGMPMQGMPMQGMPMAGYAPAQDVNVSPAAFQPFSTDVNPLTQKENIELIKDVPLEVTVELGRTTKSIKDILEFAPGTIVELNKIAGESVDVLVNGKYVAKGEVVVIEESFGVRITEIIK